MKNAAILSGLFLLAAAGICADAASAERFNPSPVIPRRIEIKSEAVISVASEGKALCEVVVPAKSSPMLQYAGKQLAFYLEKIIGSNVAVKTKPSGSNTAFVLGPSGAKLAGFDLSGLDRDGYIIKTVGNRIVIAGSDDPRVNPEKQKSIPYMKERGTLNGVYEFLERFGGVRFYFPGEIGTVVPRKPDWKLPQIDIVDRPDMTYRRIYYGKSALGKKTVFYGGPTEREIRMLSAFQTRQSTLFMPNCHGLAYLGLVQRFGKTHPEYFALRDNGLRINGVNPTNPHEIAGQLCFSSVGLKQEIYLDAKAFLTGQSASSRGVVMPNGKSYWEASRHRLPFFNIHPNDGLYPCRCPKCKPVFAAGPQASSNLIWKFKTDIARKLKQEGIPGYLTMMAYGCYTNIPELDIPDNVIVQLAQSGPWNESNPVSQAKALKKLHDWKKKLGTNPYLWNYVVKTGNRGAALYIPSFTPRAVGSYFKKAAPDICGSFLQSDTDCWLFSFMNSYVFGKLMWDVSTDTDALMEEHFRLMYGPAAPEMKEFYDTMERHWMKDISGKIEDTPLGPVPVYPSYFKIWTEIYGPAEIGRINKLFDSAEKKASGSPDSLKRVKFMRKEMLGQVLEGAKIFNRSANDRKLWTVYVHPAQEKIRIDGKLDEAVWKRAETIWLLPEKGKPAEVHTRVRMLADQENYYVGIECDEPHTDQMVNTERKTDEIAMWRDNVAELFFSSGRDASFLYQIMLTSAGQICDFRSERRMQNVGWNSGLEYKHSVIPGKMWIAEVRIPRKSMPELKGKEFAVNFTRSRILKPGFKVGNLYYSWFPRSYAGHTPENFGNAIIGIRPKSKSVIRCGDFDGRVIGKRMYSGKRPAWHTEDTGFAPDRQFFMTGGQSVRLELPGGNREMRQFFHKKELKPGTRYRVSFYFKMENVVNPKKRTGGFFMDLRFGKKGPDNALFPLNPSPLGSMEWNRYQFEFTAPEGTGTDRSPYLGFYLPKEARGKVWISAPKRF